MRNLWIQREVPFAAWVADLESRRTSPDALLQLTVAVIRAGVEHQVFDVASAPLIDYERERDGALAARLEALHREQGVIDLFGFTGAAMAPGAPGSSTAEALLSWYDRNDDLVEGRCADLGDLLASLEPVPESIPDGFMAHYPPIRVTGQRLEREGRPLLVRFAIHSDIWFPWVFGAAHPQADHERMFDNRELASRHTPRLNAFLRAVAAATHSAGGRWSVDEDDTGKNVRSWLDTEGLKLDAPPPEAIFPPEALAAEWY
jgi:hypothetical protein